MEPRNCQPCARLAGLFGPLRPRSLCELYNIILHLSLLSKILIVQDPDLYRSSPIEFPNEIIILAIQSINKQNLIWLAAHLSIWLFLIKN